MSTIRGSVFQDLNGNSIFDLGEGLPNVTVFLDDNGDGLPGELEQIRLTDFNGEYTFSDLPAGTFILDQVTPPGFNEPIGVPVPLTTSGDVNERIDVNILNLNPNPVVPNPIPTAGVLSGAIYVDNNRNRIYEPFGEGGEPTFAAGFPDAFVYIDLNNSGFFEPSEPSAAPNEAGFYIFEGLPPGQYLLRADLPSGFELIDNGTSIESNSIVANVALGPNQLDIGVINPNSIYGRVIRDINGNGQPDPFEPPQADIDITVTDSNDRVRTATTNSDGFYIVTGLDTSIDGEDDAQNPFAQFISRTDPARFANSFDIEFGVASSAYVFTSPVPPLGALPGEIGLTITQDQSRQVNSTLVFNPAGGVLLLPDSITGVVFNDRNANSLLDFDPLTGLPDEAISGATVYIDLDDDGELDSGEPSTTTDFNGNFALTSLLPTPNIDPISGFSPIADTYVVRVEPTGDQENLTTPIAAITLGAGEAAQLALGLSSAVPFPPDNQFAQPGGGIDADALIPVRGFLPGAVPFIV